MATSTAASNPNAPWLIMLYMAGDNNLSEEMVAALQALVAQGAPNGSIIVAQFDPSGIGLETQRYVFDGPGLGSLEAHRLQTFDTTEINTGSVEALTAFIEWAASHDTGGTMQYMLVLSGHGGGTSEDFLLKDDNAQDALSMSELKEALTLSLPEIRTRSGNPYRVFDILGFDACFMSMGEVALQVAAFADILVGAEGLEPAFGWPYGRLIARAKEREVNAAVHPTRDDLAREIVSEYVTHYHDYDRTAGRSADLSAVKLEELEGVKDAFEALVTDLTNSNDPDKHNKLLLAHWYAQTYKSDQYVDLYDLCVQLAKQFPTTLAVSCTAVKNALEPTRQPPCILRTGCSGFAYQHSHGISIYFPWAYLSPDYVNIEFAPGWYTFLESHLKTTQRESRFVAEPGGAVPAPAEDVVLASQTRRARLLALKASVEQPGGSPASGVLLLLDEIDQEIIAVTSGSKT